MGRPPVSTIRRADFLYTYQLRVDDVFGASGKLGQHCRQVLYPEGIPDLPFSSLDRECSTTL